MPRKGEGEPTPCSREIGNLGTGTHARLRRIRYLSENLGLLKKLN